MEAFVYDYSMSFEALEKKIDYACLIARLETKQILEVNDAELFKGKVQVRIQDKGLRKTSIKTVYGEAEYSRHV